ncbi:MAG: recombinase family protein [Armatimonadetes bacterium]|nr:recombinase family protein [Armatimonadota bacterium]
MSKDRFIQFKRDYYAMTGTMARLGMEKMAKSGIYPLRLPIGYRRVYEDGGERIEIDQVTAPLVRLAFKLAGQKRSSLTKILAVVRARGLNGHSRTPITRSALHRMLTNGFYAGVLHRKGESLEGAHAQLVSGGAFRSVQDELSRRRK